MKEQILHLDPHDDSISARDKMGWVQTERVLLVWPERGRVLTRRLDLVLVHRHAHQLGAHLGLVTDDDLVKEHAAGLGLPVFSSVEASRRMRWRSRLPARPGPRPAPAADPEEFTPRPARPVSDTAGRAWLAVRLVVFTAALGAVLGMAYALLPSAQITVAPALQEVRLTLPLAADPDIHEILPGGPIPARRIRLEVEQRTLTATTGVKDVPHLPAAGSVLFTNLFGTAVSIPAGTGVRTTSGTAVARFVTTRAASLEARAGATVEVPIQAVAPGPAGNVAAGRINAIDGPLGLQLAVINASATQGGTLTQRAAVTAFDRQALRAALERQLEEAVLAAAQAQLQPGEFLGPQSLSLDGTVAETYNHSLGETADTLELVLRLAYTALVVDERDARAAAEAALEQAAPAGTRRVPGPIQFERGAVVGLDEQGRVVFQVMAAAPAAPIIDPDAVRRLARHRPLDEAVRLLAERLPLGEAPRLEVRPAWFARWFRRLPALDFRIRVSVEVAR